jgi:CDP-diacylglycerol--glycerol-3-phosphate 3-phosphatidyltransferase
MQHIPNLLTIGRFALTGLLLWMILYAKHIDPDNLRGFLLIAFILFVVTGLTDVLDGYLARKYEVTSKFGRIADPLADKFLICGAFFCIAIARQPQFAHIDISPLAMDIFRWSTAIIITAREIIVTVRRQIAESRGINFGAIASGKLKMFLQAFGIGTVIFKWAFVEAAWGDWFTIATFTLMLIATIYSGIESIKRPIKHPPEK